MSEWSWCLVSVTANPTEQRCIQLNQFPFEVGRSGKRDLIVPCPHVSKSHAVFFKKEGTLFLQDLGSTNGSFVNGQQQQGVTSLQADDIIQFGRFEFRLSKVETSVLKTMSLGQFSLSSVEFKELLKRRAIKPNYQPIVEIETGEVIGYEVLVRSIYEGLKGASELFLAASRLGMECQLSEISRSEGMSQGRSLPSQATRFLNTHPSEILSPHLLTSLQQLREANVGVPIVLEIHESSICDATAMKQLAMGLKGLDIGLAYDDFGQGQSRILELIEAPSDYLKFDIELIRGIDRAPRTRQQLLASLVQMAKDIGIKTVAEGVETRQEVEVCRELGFDVAQGFYYCRPQPIEWIIAEVAHSSWMAERHSMQTVEV